MIPPEKSENNPVPAWCRPNGWVYHLPTSTVFQSVKLQRHNETGAYYLRDCKDGDYPVTECEALTPEHLKQAAILVTRKGITHLVPHPRGVFLPSERILIAIPDEVEKAAQSLAECFGGQVTHVEEAQ